LCPRQFLPTTTCAFSRGHCDPTTDSYNLALGEARARTVKQELTVLGIDPERLPTISYGEFRPVSNDNNLNRRVEFRPRQ
jgi:peptidoglycan-associated lipoprotein